MSKEIEVGKVFFSYAEERQTKAADELKAERAFVPEARDDARLLPRLREAVRR